MTYRAVLRGYLLEEALAWLLRNTGYRLLVHESQDTEALVMRHGALCVRGRGADHQADVLGEFALSPAFSLPIRMFIEAKYYRRARCDLPIVRNGHGVIHDINENFIYAGSSRPRRRYQYAYAVFSASGFTRTAQDYALAQQISLVDLSGASFGWLRQAISAAAAELFSLRNQYQVRVFPVTWMRRELRRWLLDTVLFDEVATEPATNAPHFRSAAEPVIRDFASTLLGHLDAELLLGFPAAPFILPLAAENLQEFLTYADHRTAHPVRLRRAGSGSEAEWAVTPLDEPEAYRLSFSLPERLESWISENEELQRKRISIIKDDFLSAITIYRLAHDEVRLYQLKYEPAELRRPEA
jgi:hypothetical protein